MQNGEKLPRVMSKSANIAGPQAARVAAPLAAC